MASRDDLITLAARCEAASGEMDRALDGLIGIAVNPAASLWTPDWWSGGPNEYLRWPDLPSGESRYETVPYYTSSIDAAVTLVPDGAHWQVGRDVGPWAAVWTKTRLPSHCLAATPALALCAAALRALAHQAVR
jgi:hypothetical protein